MASVIFITDPLCGWCWLGDPNGFARLSPTSAAILAFALAAVYNGRRFSV